MTIETLAAGARVVRAAATGADDLALSSTRAAIGSGATASTGGAQVLDGALQVGVLGRADDPSVHNIGAALQARGATAHLIDLADVRVVGDRLYLGNDPFPKLHAAVAYHGAEVPTGGMKAMKLLQGQGVSFINTPKSITVSRDKWLAGDALQKAGVRTPLTVLARTAEEARAGVAQVGSPTIVKLRIGTEGKGVAKITNPNEVPPIVDLMSASKRNAVLQQMVKMEEPADIRAFVVDGKVVAAMERRVGASTTGDFRTNVSNGGTAVPITLHPDDERAAIAAADALGLDVAGVDLMGDRAKMYVIEGNSGPGQKIRDITGVDVGDAIAELAIRRAAANAAAR